jgi:hypothetical protein
MDKGIPGIGGKLKKPVGDGQAACGRRGLFRRIVEKKVAHTSFITIQRCSNYDKIFAFYRNFIQYLEKNAILNYASPLW